MPFESFLIKIAGKRAACMQERATNDPMRAQINKLLWIVRKNRDTEYGKRYGFSSIRNVSDYQKQVPVVEYEDIREDVERMTAGEQNILTAETPVMFTLTSGTTGKPKFIPVTPTCQKREQPCITRAWSYYVIRDHPEIGRRKIVSLVSPAVEGYTLSGIPYGSASGSIYRDMPRVVHHKYAVPYEVFDIRDYHAKYYTIMRLSMEQDVSLICTANPSSILKMCEKGDQFSEKIIRDIHDGTLSKDFEIEKSIREHLEKRLKPNSSKSSFLEYVRDWRGGILMPADYWPNLSLIGCWKGGTVGHYIESFPCWFDPDGKKPIPVRDWGYLSSEARCSIPVSDRGSAGILAVANNFYEFVAVEDIQANEKNPSCWKFLTADQIEDAKEYYIFITTTGGLYRYDINDIIRVQGRYNKTPQIVFVRKGRDMANITGEKLSVDQVIKAIKHASGRTRLAVSHFRVEADIETSRYILRVEFFASVPEERAKTFLRAFDGNLKHVNIEYKCKRDSLRLNYPVLHIMCRGWHEQGQKYLVENGGRAFQGKTQVLSPILSDPNKIRSQIDHVIEISEPQPAAAGR